ncbi:hypothetical protein JCM8547_000434 [Rhodosporidiobolus lusitaniae]
MVKKKSPAAVQAPSALAPARAPAPAPPNVSPLPIAHYLPKLPLQLIAILFSFFIPSSRVVKEDHILGPARLVTALTRDPLAVLPLACGLLVVVQTWFGYWARSCRKEAQRAAKGDEGEVVVKQALAAKEKKGFKGNLKEVFGKALGGEAPHQQLWKQARDVKASEALGGLDTRFVPQAVGTTLAATAIFHVITVLLGAPLVSHFSETSLLCLCLSILAILPLSIAIPPLNGSQEQYTWLRLSSLSPNDDLELALLLPAVGAIVGCWLGAVPIPLDWDRPWQKWPTTCVVGALVGHFAGSIVSLAVTSYRGALRAAADVVREAKEQEDAKAKVGEKKVVVGKKGGKAQ